MKILHCVTDEKFIDGAISLYEQDNRMENRWVHFVKEDISSLTYIKSTQVEVVNLNRFDDMMNGNLDGLIYSYLQMEAKKNQK